MVKVAIFHEGNEKKTHDNELLKLLIKNLGLAIEKVKFVGMGGKSNFFNINYNEQGKFENENYRELLLDIKREAIKKVLFVIDADYFDDDEVYGGFENTKNEIKKVFKELNIENIADFYITCDPQEKCGYLESFILSTIPNEQKECINNFLDCSNFKSKENHKAILNQIYKIAYPEAPFDFSHPNFNELKEKLQNLFEGI